MSDQNPLKAGSLRYKALLDEALDLHVRKNTGYAGQNPDAFSNFRLAEGMGLSAVQGVLVRMGDKFARIQSLAKNPENDKVGESMRDTLMDLSAYALIAICLMEEAAEPDAKKIERWFADRSFWYDENGDRRKEVLDSASDEPLAVHESGEWSRPCGVFNPIYKTNCSLNKGHSGWHNGPTVVPFKGTIDWPGHMGDEKEMC